MDLQQHVGSIKLFFMGALKENSTPPSGKAPLSSSPVIKASNAITKPE
jgi:hypothetical protein